MQGDGSPNIYFIRTGRVRMFYIGENGKEVTYRIIGEGQLVGEAAFLSHLRQSTISAVKDTELLACPVGGSLSLYRKQQSMESGNIRIAGGELHRIM